MRHAAHHAGGRVHHDDRARAEHRPRVADLVLAERQLDLVRPEPRRRDATGDEGLERVRATDAAAEQGRIDEVAEGGLHHLELVVARLADVPGQCEEPGARRTAGTERGEGRAAVVHDPGDVGHRLDVVDDRGLAVEPDGGGEVRRLDAGEAALALERLEERRLFAADVGAGTRVHDDVDRKARVEDLRTDGTVRIRVVHGLLHPLEPEGELPADVDEGLADLQRVGGDEHPFEDLVRVVLDEHVVLERRRLRLVSVDHQVGDGVLAEHRPLPSGREARTTSSEQAGRIDFGRHRLGRHGQRLAQPAVTAGREVALEGVRVLVVQARRDDLGSVRDRHQALSPAPAVAAARAPLASASLARSATMAARSACRPPLRRTRTRVPWGGTVSSSRPARRSSTRRVERGGRLGADVAVVHLHTHRLVAVGQALRLVQSEDAVRRRAAGTHAQRGLGVPEQLERATEQAGDVRAHGHDVLPDGLGVQHVVEGGGALHLGRGDAAELADLGDGLRAQPPVLLLRQMAQRDERGTPLGVEHDEILGRVGASPR